MVGLPRIVLLMFMFHKRNIGIAPTRDSSIFYDQRRADWRGR